MWPPNDRPLEVVHDQSQSKDHQKMGSIPEVDASWLLMGGR